MVRGNKRKYIKKKSAAWILVFAMLFMTIGTNDVHAEVAESLNNLVDENGELIKRVSGDPQLDKNKTNLQVEISSSELELTAYKIATITWDDTTKTYSDPMWVGELSSWIGDAQLRGDAFVTKNVSALSSPKNLSIASKDIIDDFFDILKDESGLLSSLEKVSASSYSNKEESVEGVDEKVTRFYNTFYGLSFGTYLIQPVGEFKPVVVNIVPKRDSTGYYTYEFFKSALKAGGLNLDKRINWLEGDTVAIGDEVEFEIAFNKPSGLTASSSMVLTDRMSKAFRFDDTKEVSVSADETGKLLLKEGVHYNVGARTQNAAKETVFLITFEASELYMLDFEKIYVTYGAVVTNEAEHNSELNYNTAEFTVDTLSDTDTVCAYTYGVNVVKLDGSSSKDEEQMRTLPGAEFVLYRERFIYLEDEYAGTVDSVSGMGYKKIEELNGGEGTETNPFKIYTEEDLKKIGTGDHSLSKEYVLMNDITLTNGTWNSIGTAQVPFSGKFDGQGFLIQMGEQTTPLFDAVTGSVQNLTVDGNISGANAILTREVNGAGDINNVITNGNLIPTDYATSVGAICSSMAGSARIRNSANNAIVGNNSANNGQNYRVGGLVGSQDGSATLIINCTNNGRVYGYEQVGGIVGYSSGRLNYDFNVAPVDCRNSYAGGIVGDYNSGYANTDEYFNHCYNIETITSKNPNVGGIVGRMENSNLAGCINTGDVICETRVSEMGEGYEFAYYRAGGIVGFTNESNVDYVASTGQIICYINRANSEATNPIIRDIYDATTYNDSGYYYAGNIIGDDAYGRSVAPTHYATATNSVGGMTTTPEVDVQLSSVGAAKRCGFIYFNWKLYLADITVTYDQDFHGMEMPDKTLEEYKADSNRFYIYETEAKEAGTIEGTTTSYAKNDKLVRVFEKVTIGNGFSNAYGEIVSVDDRNGVTISGLDAGSYILVETKAPAGYKELTEDVYFEINKLTQDQANLHNRGSYSAFYEMGGTELNTTGCHNVVVLNYKGFFLPSTGGMGTRLFVIAGCGIMLIAFAIAIKKRRQRSKYEY